MEVPGRFIELTLVLPHFKRNTSTTFSIARRDTPLCFANRPIRLHSITCSLKVVSVDLSAALSHEEPIMLCRFTQICFVILLAAIATDARADDDKKTDRDTKVTAGT